MYVTYDQYKGLGYTTVPEPQYARFAMIAESSIRIATQNRITDEHLSPSEDSDDEAKRIATMNKMGVCEIIDRYYIAANPNSEAAVGERVVVGFSNGKYSETYLGAQRTDAGAAAPERMGISDILNAYFTDDQLWRGVGA